MYCVPACVGCKRAGVCGKGSPQAPAPLPARKGPRRAVAATYPRERIVYTHLVCGHMTDRGAQLFFSVWAPKPDEGPAMMYCEACKDWRAPRKPDTVPLDTLPF